MKLQALTLRGFGPFFEEFTLTLDDGILFFFGKNEKDPAHFGSNGSGKSRILMALTWCLTGRLPMKVKKDEVINRASDECYTEVVFDVLTVRRSIKRGYAESLYFKTADGEEGKGDLKEVKARLREILGVDDDLFYNSLWIDGESKTVQFLFAQPAERMEILEGLLAKDLFAKTRKLAADEQSEAKQRKAKHEAEIESLLAQKERESTRLERAETALAQYEERIKQAERTRDTRAAEIRQEVKDAEQAMTIQKNRLGQKGAAADEVKALEHQEAGLVRQIAVVEAAIASFQRIARLKTGDPCPTCGQDVTEDCVAPAARNLKKMYAEQDAAEKEHEATRKALRDARQRRTDCDQAEYALKTLQQTVKRLSEEAARLTTTVDYGSRKDLQLSVTSTQEALRLCKMLGQTTEDAMKRAKQDVEDCATLVDTFGSKGLRTVMLDRVRAMMQHHVNQYMLRLVGEAFTIQFPPSKSGFDIVLVTEDGPVSVECFSKGEVWRANIAVLMALRKTLQYMRTTPLNFLVLDDPCSGSVDEVGVENIVGTIMALSEEFDQVFVTLPQEVPVPYDRALLVVKDAEGFSEIRSYTA